jgi:hypothetical protein
MSRSGLPSHGSCTDSRDRDSRTVTHHIRVSLIMSNELIIKLQGTSKAANLNDGSESGWVLDKMDRVQVSRAPAAGFSHGVCFKLDCATVTHAGGVRLSAWGGLGQHRRVLDAP